MNFNYSFSSLFTYHKPKKKVKCPGQLFAINHSRRWSKLVGINESLLKSLPAAHSLPDSATMQVLGEFCLHFCVSQMLVLKIQDHIICHSTCYCWGTSSSSKQSEISKVLCSWQTRITNFGKDVPEFHQT